MTSFRTKRGRCIIDDDRLYLTSSITGLLRRYYEGSRLVFGIICLGIIGIVVSIIQGQAIPLVIGAGLGIAVTAVGYAANWYRGFVHDSIIPLDEIQAATLVRGQKGLTRPRFVLELTDDRRRYIMLPSLWLDYAEDEIVAGRQALEDAGIPVTGPGEDE